jgi:4-amino-4-deoxy-L-arabinose transferase-like glycosyltransferase
VGTFTPYEPTTTSQATSARRSGRKLPRAGITVALVSLWLGIIWVATVPPMNAPDEPAYLQTVMETRNKRMLPEIHFDFSKNPLGDIVGDPGDPVARDYAARHNMAVSIRLVPYQNSQPPLYFMIVGPLAMLLPPDPQTILYMSRLISVLFGAGTVFFCWAAARQLAPRSPMWAVAAAGVIALLPQFCFNNARVSNDSLVNCLGAAAFYIWFRSLRQPAYDPWMLRAGGIVGLALLAKLTAVVLVPGLALVVLFRAFQAGEGETKWRARLLRGARMAAGMAGAALALFGWWLVRNLIAYGEVTGAAGVNRFYKANLPGINLAIPDMRAQFIGSTWQSFWGFFGWQDIAMPDSFYSQAGFFTIAFFGLTGLAALGIIAWRFVRWRRNKEQVIIPTYSWQAVSVLFLVGIALVVAYVQYTLQVAEAAQGRYLYLMLLPAALLFTGGLYALAPHRILKVIALSIPILWLAVMNFVGLRLV